MWQVWENGNNLYYHKNGIEADVVIRGKESNVSISIEDRFLEDHLLLGNLFDGPEKLFVVSTEYESTDFRQCTDFAITLLESWVGIVKAKVDTFANQLNVTDFRTATEPQDKTFIIEHTPGLFDIRGTIKYQGGEYVFLYDIDLTSKFLIDIGLLNYKYNTPYTILADVVFSTPLITTQNNENLIHHTFVQIRRYLQEMSNYISTNKDGIRTKMQPKFITGE